MNARNFVAAMGASSQRTPHAAMLVLRSMQADRKGTDPFVNEYSVILNVFLLALTNQQFELIAWFSLGESQEDSG